MDELDACDAGSLRLSEDLDVVRWRTERLLALGYELFEAARLAVTQIDTHELEQLISKGCPPETAARIVA